MKAFGDNVVIKITREQEDYITGEVTSISECGTEFIKIGDVVSVKSRSGVFIPTELCNFYVTDESFILVVHEKS